MEMYDLLLAKKLGGGGGGGSVTVEALSVTENGTYTAPEGKAYSPVDVNVSGSGGGFQPILKKELGEITTTSSTEELVETVKIEDASQYDTFIFIVSRKESGTNVGEFLGSIRWGSVYWGGNTAWSSVQFGSHDFYLNSSGNARAYAAGSTIQRGVYVTANRPSGQDYINVNVYKKYYSDYGSVTGHYVLNVYAAKVFDRVSKTMLM